jgi:uncharacterized SAM-binding protein YcdF (DUF218 family)
MRLHSQLDDDARLLFDYLYLRDPEPAAADAVIGFGHFDMKVPRRCLELYRQGRAPLIVFTGGIGAGTADLGRPEAQAFLGEVRRNGGVAEKDVLIEDRSTHTGENLAATARLLAEHGRPLGTDGGIGRAVIVATAYRQRRVFLTCRLHHPGVRFINAPPVTSFDAERSMFAEKGQDLVALLCGEVRRLIDYPDRGFCLPAEIPPEILAALRQTCVSS